RLLQRQVVIQSLVIERPVVMLRWSAEGVSNLPSRRAKTAQPAAGAEESGSSWSLATEKVLLVDGSVEGVMELPGDGAGDRAGDASYRVHVPKILGDWRQGHGRGRLTLLSDAVRVSSTDVLPPALKLSAEFEPLPRIEAILQAGVRATLELPGVLRT